MAIGFKRANRRLLTRLQRYPAAKGIVLYFAASRWQHSHHADFVYLSHLWRHLVPAQAPRGGQGHGMGRWWEPAAAAT